MQRQSEDEMDLVRRILRIDPEFNSPPDWRFQYGVCLLRDRRLVPPEWIDKLVRVARCLAERRIGRNSRANERLLAEHPGALPALEIHEANQFMRWEIEARLLANESYPQIAQKCATRPDVIETYHEIFFRVRPRLHVPAHVHRMILPDRTAMDLTEADVEFQLKVFGFQRGPVFLDALVDYYRNPPVVPERLDGLDAATIEKLLDKILMKAAIVSRAMPIDGAIFKRIEAFKYGLSVIEKHGLNDLTADLICATFGIPRSVAQQESSDTESHVG